MSEFSFGIEMTLAVVMAAAGGIIRGFRYGASHGTVADFALGSC